MELDDFKKGKMYFSAKDESFGSQEIESIKGLIKADFKKQKRAARIFVTYLICLVVIYISLHEKGNFLFNLGLTSSSVGFLLGALYIYFKSKLLSDSLYCLPLVDFLSAIESRLQYMKLFDWLIIVPLLLLLGTGGGFIFTSRLLNYTDNIYLLIIIWISFFTGLSVFGFWAGRKNWIKEHGALIDKVRTIKGQLGEM